MRRRFKGQIALRLLATVLLLSAVGAAAHRGDAAAGGGRAVTRSQWSPVVGAPPPAAPKAGSFSVSRPWSEGRVAGWERAAWRPAARSLLRGMGDDGLRDFGQARAREWLESGDFPDWEEDFSDWWGGRQEGLLLGLANDSADWLLSEATSSATAAAEEGAESFGFVRNIEVDYRSELGSRRWQAGVSALGALREGSADALVWQLRGYAADEGGAGGNIGLLWRAFPGGANGLGPSGMFGANVFLDYERHGDYGEAFWRWSAGVEYRSAWVDLFANSYWSLGDSVEKAIDGQVLGIYGRDGFDLELALHAPDFRWISGEMGYYNWRGQYGQKDDKGLRYALVFSPSLGDLELRAEYAQPEEGNGDWGGEIRWRHRFNAPAESYTWSSDGEAEFDALDYLYAPARREYAQRISAATLRAQRDADLIVLASAAVGSGGLRIDGTMTILAAAATTDFDYTMTVVAGAAADSRLDLRSTMFTMALEHGATISMFNAVKGSLTVGWNQSGTLSVARDGAPLTVITAPKATLTLLGTTLRLYSDGSEASITLRLTEGELGAADADDLLRGLVLGGRVEINGGAIVGCEDLTTRAPEGVDRLGSRCAIDVARLSWASGVVAATAEAMHLGATATLSRAGGGVVRLTGDRTWASASGFPLPVGATVSAESGGSLVLIGPSARATLSEGAVARLAAEDRIVLLRGEAVIDGEAESCRADEASPDPESCPDVVFAVSAGDNAAVEVVTTAASGALHTLTVAGNIGGVLVTATMDGGDLGADLGKFRVSPLGGGGGTVFVISHVSALSSPPRTGQLWAVFADGRGQLATATLEASIVASELLLAAERDNNGKVAIGATGAVATLLASGGYVRDGSSYAYSFVSGSSDKLEVDAASGEIRLIGGGLSAAEPTAGAVFLATDSQGKTADVEVVFAIGFVATPANVIVTTHADRLSGVYTMSVAGQEGNVSYSDSSGFAAIDSNSGEIDLSGLSAGDRRQAVFVATDVRGDGTSETARLMLSVVIVSALAIDDEINVIVAPETRGWRDAVALPEATSGGALPIVYSIPAGGAASWPLLVVDGGSGEISQSGGGELTIGHYSEATVEATDALGRTAEATRFRLAARLAFEKAVAAGSSQKLRVGYTGRVGDDVVLAKAGGVAADEITYSATAEESDGTSRGGDFEIVALAGGSGDYALSAAAALSAGEFTVTASAAAANIAGEAELANGGEISVGVYPALVFAATTFYRSAAGVAGNLSAAGGDGEYTYRKVGGDADVAVDAAGEVRLGGSGLSGDALMTVVVELTDGVGDGAAARATITAKAELALSAERLGGGRVGADYTGAASTLRASGGAGNYTYEKVSGDAELNLESASVVVIRPAVGSGGQARAIFRATDGAGAMADLELAFASEFLATPTERAFAWRTSERLDSLPDMRVAGAIGVVSYRKLAARFNPPEAAADVNIDAASGEVELARSLAEGTTITAIFEATDDGGAPGDNADDVTALYTLVIMAYEGLAIDDEINVVVAPETRGWRNAAALPDATSGGDPPLTYSIPAGGDASWTPLAVDGASGEISQEGGGELAVGHYSEATVEVEDAAGRTRRATRFRLAAALAFEKGIAAGSSQKLRVGYTGRVGDDVVLAKAGGVAADEITYSATAAESDGTARGGDFAVVALTDGSGDYALSAAAALATGEFTVTASAAAAANIAGDAEEANGGEISVGVYPALFLAATTFYRSAAGAAGNLSATGGDGEYTYRKVGGDSGLTADPSTGEARLGGSGLGGASMLTMVVELTDGVGDGAAASATITVKAELALSARRLGGGRIGEDHTGAAATLSASGGEGNYTYEKVSGAANLILESASVVVIRPAVGSGGRARARFRATDRDGVTADLDLAFASEFLATPAAATASVYSDESSGEIYEMIAAGAVGEASYALAAAAEFNPRSARGKLSIDGAGRIALAGAFAAGTATAAFVATDDGNTPGDNADDATATLTLVIESAAPLSADAVDFLLRDVGDAGVALADLSRLVSGGHGAKTYAFAENGKGWEHLEVDGASGALRVASGRSLEFGQISTMTLEADDALGRRPALMTATLAASLAFEKSIAAGSSLKLRAGYTGRAGNVVVLAKAGGVAAGDITYSATAEESDGTDRGGDFEIVALTDGSGDYALSAAAALATGEFTVTASAAAANIAGDAEEANGGEISVGVYPALVFAATEFMGYETGAAGRLAPTGGDGLYTYAEADPQSPDLAVDSATGEVRLLSDLSYGATRTITVAVTDGVGDAAKTAEVVIRSAPPLVFAAASPPLALRLTAGSGGRVNNGGLLRRATSGGVRGGGYSYAFLGGAVTATVDGKATLVITPSTGALALAAGGSLPFGVKATFSVVASDGRSVPVRATADLLLAARLGFERGFHSGTAFLDTTTGPLEFRTVEFSAGDVDLSEVELALEFFDGADAHAAHFDIKTVDGKIGERVFALTTAATLKDVFPLAAAATPPGVKITVELVATGENGAGETETARSGKFALTVGPEMDFPDRTYIVLNRFNDGENGGEIARYPDRNIFGEISYQVLARDVGGELRYASGPPRLRWSGTRNVGQTNNSHTIRLRANGALGDAAEATFVVIPRKLISMEFEPDPNVGTVLVRSSESAAMLLRAVSVTARFDRSAIVVGGGELAPSAPAIVPSVEGVATEADKFSFGKRSDDDDDYGFALSLTGPLPVGIYTVSILVNFPGSGIGDGRGEIIVRSLSDVAFPGTTFFTSNAIPAAALDPDALIVGLLSATGGHAVDVADYDYVVAGDGDGESHPYLEISPENPRALTWKSRDESLALDAESLSITIIARDKVADEVADAATATVTVRFNFITDNPRRESKVFSLALAQSAAPGRPVIAATMAARFGWGAHNYAVIGTPRAGGEDWPGWSVREFDRGDGEKAGELRFTGLPSGGIEQGDRATVTVRVADSRPPAYSGGSLDFVYIINIGDFRFVNPGARISPAADYRGVVFTVTASGSIGDVANINYVLGEDSSPIWRLSVTTHAGETHKIGVLRKIGPLAAGESHFVTITASNGEAVDEQSAEYILEARPAAPRFAAFAPRHYHAAASFGGSLYVIGGVGGEDVWGSADGRAWGNVISSKTENILPGQERHAVEGHLGRLYVISGVNLANAEHAQVWSSFNGADWMMRSGNVIPSRRRHEALSFGGSLYVIGGAVGGGGSQADIWRSADGRNWGKVNQAAAAELPARVHFGAAAVGGTLYVIGGLDSDGDERSDVWFSANGGVNWGKVNQAAAAALPVRANFDAAAVGGTLYVIGGADADGVEHADVWFSANGGVNWRQASGDLSQFVQRKDHAAAAHLGRLYMLGGRVGRPDGDIVLNDSLSSQDGGANWDAPPELSAAERAAAAAVLRLNADRLNFSLAIDDVGVFDNGAIGGVISGGAAPLTYILSPRSAAETAELDLTMDRSSGALSNRDRLPVAYRSTVFALVSDSAGATVEVEAEIVAKLAFAERYAAAATAILPNDYVGDVGPVAGGLVAPVALRATAAGVAVEDVVYSFSATADITANLTLLSRQDSGNAPAGYVLNVKSALPVGVYSVSVLASVAGGADAPESEIVLEVVERLAFNAESFVFATPDARALTAAADLATGGKAPIVFAIVADAESTDDEKFAIRGGNLELTEPPPPDGEFYNIRVAATDAAGWSATANMQIIGRVEFPEGREHEIKTHRDAVGLPLHTLALVEVESGVSYEVDVVFPPPPPPADLAPGLNSDNAITVAAAPGAAGTTATITIRAVGSLGGLRATLSLGVIFADGLAISSPLTLRAPGGRAGELVGGGALLRDATSGGHGALVYALAAGGSDWEHLRLAEDDGALSVADGQMLAHGGRHTATLNVTDETGRTETATLEIIASLTYESAFTDADNERVVLLNDYVGAIGPVAGGVVAPVALRAKAGDIAAADITYEFSAPESVTGNLTLETTADGGRVLSLTAPIAATGSYRVSVVARGANADGVEEMAVNEITLQVVEMLEANIIQRAQLESGIYYPAEGMPVIKITVSKGQKFSENRPARGIGDDGYDHKIAADFAIFSINAAQSTDIELQLKPGKSVPVDVAYTVTVFSSDAVGYSLTTSVTVRRGLWERGDRKRLFHLKEPGVFHTVTLVGGIPPFTYEVSRADFKGLETFAVRALANPNEVELSLKKVVVGRREVNTGFFVRDERGSVVLFRPVDLAPLLDLADAAFYPRGGAVAREVPPAVVPPGGGIVGQLMATGAGGPLQYGRLAGQTDAPDPAILSVSSDGMVSLNAALTGADKLTLTVTVNDNSIEQRATAVLVIGAPLEMAAGGTVYRFAPGAFATLEATGGDGAYSYAIAPPSPSGLTLTTRAGESGALVAVASLTTALSGDERIAMTILATHGGGPATATAAVVVAAELSLAAELAADGYPTGDAALRGAAAGTLRATGGEPPYASYSEAESFDVGGYVELANSSVIVFSRDLLDDAAKPARFLVEDSRNVTATLDVVINALTLSDEAFRATLGAAAASEAAPVTVTTLLARGGVKPFAYSLAAVEHAGGKDWPGLTLTVLADGAGAAVIFTSDPPPGARTTMSVVVSDASERTLTARITVYAELMFAAENDDGELALALAGRASAPVGGDVDIFTITAIGGGVDSVFAYPSEKPDEFRVRVEDGAAIVRLAARFPRGGRATLTLSARANLLAAVGGGQETLRERNRFVLTVNSAAPVGVAGAAYAYHDGKFYAIGGREIMPVSADRLAGSLSIALSVVRSSRNAVDWTSSDGEGLPARWRHRAASFGGNLYVIGGFDGGANGGTALNDVWRSSDGGATWAKAGDAQFAARGNFGLVEHLGRLYVIGGGKVLLEPDANCAFHAIIHCVYRTGNNHSDVWSTADGVTWRRESDGAALGKRSNPAVLSHNGSIYVIGGRGKPRRGDYIVLPDVWSSADGSKWRKVEAEGLPGNAGGAAVAHIDVIQQKTLIYVILGRLGHFFDDSVYSFDPKAETPAWNFLGRISDDASAQPRETSTRYRSRRAAFSIDGVLYAVGGDFDVLTRPSPSEVMALASYDSGATWFAPPRRRTAMPDLSSANAYYSAGAASLDVYELDFDGVSREDSVYAFTVTAVLTDDGVNPYAAFGDDLTKLLTVSDGVGVVSLTGAVSAEGTLAMSIRVANVSGVPPLMLTLNIRQLRAVSAATTTATVSSGAVFATVSVSGGAPPYTYEIDPVAGDWQGWEVFPKSGPIGAGWLRNLTPPPALDARSTLTIRATDSDGAAAEFAVVALAGLGFKGLGAGSVSAPANLNGIEIFRVAAGGVDIARILRHRIVSGGHANLRMSLEVETGEGVLWKTGDLPAGKTFLLRLEATGERNGGGTETTARNYVLTVSVGAALETGRFAPRHLHGVVLHDDYFYVIGGHHGELKETRGAQTYGDVWRSADGETWIQLKGDNNDYFGKRESPGAVSHGGRLYVIGGRRHGPASANYGALYNDVWSSADGRTWRLESEGKFSARWRHVVLSHRNSIYVIGGRFRSSSGQPSPDSREDIWRSADGQDWTLVAEFAANATNSFRRHPDRYENGIYGGAHNGSMYIYSSNLDSGAERALRSSRDGVVWKDLDTPWRVTHPRSSPGLLSHEGSLYIIGGADASNEDENGNVTPNVIATSDGETWATLSRGVEKIVINGKKELDKDSEFFGCVERMPSRSDIVCRRSGAGAVSRDGRLFVIGGGMHGYESYFLGAVVKRFIGNNSNRVWASDDDGATWRMVEEAGDDPNRPVPVLMSGSGAVVEYAVGASGERLNLYRPPLNGVSRAVVEYQFTVSAVVADGGSNPFAAQEFIDEHGEIAQLLTIANDVGVVSLTTAVGVEGTLAMSIGVANFPNAPPFMLTVRIIALAADAATPSIQTVSVAVAAAAADAATLSVRGAGVRWSIARVDHHDPDNAWQGWAISAEPGNPRAGVLRFRASPPRAARSTIVAQATDASGATTLSLTVIAHDEFTFAAAPPIPSVTVAANWRGNLFTVAAAGGNIRQVFYYGFAGALAPEIAAALRVTEDNGAAVISMAGNLPENSRQTLTLAATGLNFAGEEVAAPLYELTVHVGAAAGEAQFGPHDDDGIGGEGKFVLHDGKIYYFLGLTARVLAAGDTQPKILANLRIRTASDNNRDYGVASHRGSLYLTGGGVTSYHLENNVWASADGDALSWKKLKTTTTDKTLRFTPRYSANALSHGGSLYVIGGWGGFGIGDLKDVWRSADGRDWLKVKEGFEKIYHARVLSHKGLIYVIGDFTSSGHNNAVWSSADGADWTVRATGLFANTEYPWPLRPRQITAVAAASDGKTMYVFDPETKKMLTSADGAVWATTNITSDIFSIPAPLDDEGNPREIPEEDKVFKRGAGAFAMGGYLYFVNGYVTDKKVYSSSDGGATWTTPPIFPPRDPPPRSAEAEHAPASGAVLALHTLAFEGVVNSGAKFNYTVTAALTDDGDNPYAAFGDDLTELLTVSDGVGVVSLTGVVNVEGTMVMQVTATNIVNRPSFTLTVRTGSMEESSMADDSPVSVDVAAGQAASVDTLFAVATARASGGVPPFTYSLSLAADDSWHGGWRIAEESVDGANRRAASKPPFRRRWGRKQPSPLWRQTPPAFG